MLVTVLVNECQTQLFPPAVTEPPGELTYMVRSLVWSTESKYSSWATSKLAMSSSTAPPSLTMRCVKSWLTTPWKRSMTICMQQTGTVNPRSCRGTRCELWELCTAQVAAKLTGLGGGGPWLHVMGPADILEPRDRLRARQKARLW